MEHVYTSGFSHLQSVLCLREGLHGAAPVRGDHFLLPHHSIKVMHSDFIGIRAYSHNCLLGTGRFMIDSMLHFVGAQMCGSS